MTKTDPSHYKQGNYETIEIIKDMMTAEMYEGFILGNVIKYLSRYHFKNGVEDLEKAQTYLKWLTEQVRDDEELIAESEDSF